jgi:hypothetical protein
MSVSTRLFVHVIRGRWPYTSASASLDNTQDWKGIRDNAGDVNTKETCRIIARLSVKFSTVVTLLYYTIQKKCYKNFVSIYGFLENPVINIRLTHKDFFQVNAISSESNSRSY